MTPCSDAEADAEVAGAFDESHVAHAAAASVRHVDGPPRGQADDEQRDADPLDRGAGDAE